MKKRESLHFEASSLECAIAEASDAVEREK